MYTATSLLMSFNVFLISHKNPPNKGCFPLLSKDLGKERSSTFPQIGATMERDAHFQNVTLHILRGPQ
jgi:hypothetical protein